ncbi:MAG: helix-turn-helix domain-containing protein [Spirochaetota bacterium]
MGYGYGGWAPYVSVAEKRRRAEREMAKLAKKGKPALPVHIEGKTIAKTFWGKAWCRHLESYSDFENRLPRGRSYVRNGSVCHLEILAGEIRAKVAGSELYTVTITIQPLAPKAWKAIKERCSGSIASILDLLGGRLADGVMAVVTDRETGLFPKPREIALACSCPDWADMCKHVAAVLYGVGARLDEHPELLFLLRGVNHEELVSAKVEEAVSAVIKGGSRRRVAEADLSDVFGMDLGGEDAKSPGADAGMRARPRAGRAAKGAATKGASKGAAAAKGPAPKAAPAEVAAVTTMVLELPLAITGRHIRELRERLGLNGRDFAALLGVSGGAVSSWEKKSTALNLQDRSRLALEKAWKKAAKKEAATQARRKARPAKSPPR